MIECSKLHNMRGLYRQLVNMLPRTKLHPNYYKLPKYQPLYADELVAYCADKETCSIREVYLVCYPLSTCKLVVEDIVTTVYELGEKYATLLRSIVGFITHEAFPDVNHVLRTLTSDVRRAVDSIASGNVASLLRSINSSDTFRRIVAAMEKAAKEYLDKMPAPSKEERFLAHLCPNTVLGQYVRLYEAMQRIKQLSVMLHNYS